jgi:hypothetical protein
MVPFDVAAHPQQPVVPSLIGHLLYYKCDHGSFILANDFIIDMYD